MVLLTVLAGCQAGNSAGPSQAPGSSSGPRLVATLNVGSRPGTPVLGGGYVWVPNTADGTVSKIDPRTNRVVATLKVGDPAMLLAAGCGAPTVHSFPVGSFDVRLCDVPSALAFFDGTLWAAGNGDGRIIRIDPRTDRVRAEIQVGDLLAFGLAGGPSGLWAADYVHDTLVQIDSGANRVVRTLRGVGLGPAGLLVTGDAVWVALSREEAVARLDPATGAVVARIQVGQRPLAMAGTPGAVWVRNEKSSSLSRLDPASNSVAATVPIGFFMGRDGQDGIAAAKGLVWAGGVELNGVDPARNEVSARFSHIAIALAGEGQSLWTTDVANTVSRIDL